MIIYMVHPQHGAMHVYVEAEAVENEKNGWKRVAEAGPGIVIVEADATPQEIEQVDITARYEQKFGRPPHHRMKEETIRAALDGNS